MRLAARQAPTRQNLLTTMRTLARVDRGVELLRHKREALVTELVRLARPAVESQEQIAARAASAHLLLLSAMAREGESGVRVAGWPPRVLTLELRGTLVWGLPAAETDQLPTVRRTLAARQLGPTGTGAVSEAATGYEELVTLLLESAPRDLLLRRLAAALTQTSRQVNTLERRLSPALRSESVRLRRILEEREREEHVRLAMVAVTG
ncbi:MAG: V-type ATP synthase subunit D [Gemmatimonadota bacterium]